ncbi:MAG: hypothetical protein NTU61_05895 [Candidatus Altiarchaeota archaeon]|nr:hypothetical protein [Candidatus Altiarchaeota archaeon]
MLCKVIEKIEGKKPEPETTTIIYSSGERMYAYMNIGFMPQL